MADTFDGPFGTYNITTGVIDGNGKDQMGAMLISFAALFGITLTAGDGVSSAYTIPTGTPNATPDFDAIRPELRVKIAEELKAMANEMDTASEA